MLEELKADKVAISARRGRMDLKALFQEDTTKAVLRSIETTGVGKKLTEDTNECDSLDMDRLDWGSRCWNTKVDRVRNEAK